MQCEVAEATVGLGLDQGLHRREGSVAMTRFY